MQCKDDDESTLTLGEEKEEAVRKIDRLDIGFFIGVWYYFRSLCEYRLRSL